MILHRGRRGAVVVLAAACQLAGVSLATAQFPPPPGQQQQASPFPPPPGQAAPAASPFPPPPGQSGNASPFPPVGSGQPTSGSPFPGPPTGRSAAPSGPSPFAPPGSQPPPQGGGPCEGFIPIRQEAEKNAGAIRAAGERKASREEVCPLFRRFAASEAKMVAFLTKNQQTCGVPAEAVKTAKAQHAQTLKIRTQVCSAAPAARAPSLSDVLSSPAAPDAPKAGSGTFDTLTGSPLR